MKQNVLVKIEYYVGIKADKVMYTKTWFSPDRFQIQIINTAKEISNEFYPSLPPNYYI